MSVQKKFYIGDPCYAIADNQWMDFLKVLWEAQESDLFDGNFTWKGENVFCHSTAYGDGIYASLQGINFPVDAGVLGAIPLTLCDQYLSDDEVVVEMTDSNHLGSCEDGLFLIGNFSISTKNEDDDHECENCGRHIECFYDSLCSTCEQEEIECFHATFEQEEDQDLDCD